MAGIGFELKRLFDVRGVLATVRAYGYAGVVCCGPMLLGLLLQVGIIALAVASGAPRDGRELLVCLVTYALLASLACSSLFSLPVTRYIADALFAGRERAVLPSFQGSCASMLVPGCALYAAFLAVSGASLLEAVLSLWLFAEMLVNWNAMSYLTAIKDYRAILCSFIAAILVSLGAGAAALALGAPVVEGLLLAVVLGYGTMMAWDTVLLYRYFPRSDESPWDFLRYFDRFRPLALIGLLTTVGLFSHLVIVWCGPIGVEVRGLFRGAPYYDVPALVAFLTILVTTVNFVVSVEVNFYPEYRAYYGLFNEGGVVADIVDAEERMLAVLARELRYGALKQLFVTAAAISLESVVLGELPLGFNDLMHGYVRTLCVGYGLYAVGNTIMLILLYFTDYAGALAATAVFAALSTVLTWVSLWWDQSFYGFGFLLGAAAFFGIALVRLARFTTNLPYRILSRQPLVEHEREGVFSSVARLLERGRWVRG